MLTASEVSERTCVIPSETSQPEPLAAWRLEMHVRRERF